MVDYLKELGVGILFAIGGDGTLRGAQAIGEEAARRGLKIGVIGIPKTIDNDISFVQRTFGFETAVTEAQPRDLCRQRRGGGGAQRHRAGEADGPRFGIHRRLFGARQQRGELLPGSRGAVHARDGSCQRCSDRLERRGHAVIVVAEGAGQDLMANSGERDASGNVKHGDIGMFLRDAITAHFKRIGIAITLKYHRSQLHHQERAGDAARFGVLPAPRPERGSRRPQRAHEHGRQLLESPVHARADLARGLRAQEDRSAGRTLEQRGHIDRSAMGHALSADARRGKCFYGTSGRCRTLSASLFTSSMIFA